MRRIFHKPLFWFVLVVVAASVINVQRQNQSNETTYENAIASCQSGNVVRYVLHDFAEAATEARRESAAEASPNQRGTDLRAAVRYERDQRLLEEVPNAGKLGRRNCEEAIEHP